MHLSIREADISDWILMGVLCLYREGNRVTGA